MNETQLRLGHLSERDVAFLKTLVQFGGACTRSDAQRAMGIGDKSNAKRKMIALVRAGCLKRIDYSSESGFCPVYFPERSLGLHFGCERRTVENIEFAVEKAYRFAVAAHCTLRNPVSYVHGIKSWPFSASTHKTASTLQHDDPICGHTVLLTLHPTWNALKIKNRIDFWLELDPKVSIELWLPVPQFGELVLGKIPFQKRFRFHDSVFFEHTLSVSHASFIFDNANKELSNE